MTSSIGAYKRKAAKPSKMLFIFTNTSVYSFSIKSNLKTNTLLAIEPQIQSSNLNNYYVHNLHFIENNFTTI